MHDDAISLGDQLVQVLMIIRERGPSAFDHATDALMSLSKRVRAIVADEIGSIELWDPAKLAPVPDDVGQFADESFVALDGVGAFRLWTRRHGGTAGEGECGGGKQDGQKVPHRDCSSWNLPRSRHLR